MGQGNVFSLFTIGEGGAGYPRQVNSPFPRLWSQVLPGVYPFLWSHVPSGGTPVSGPMSPPGGTPVLSQVLLWGGGGFPRTRPHSGQDWGTPPPPASTVVPPPQGRLRCGRYASCGFPQGDFLVISDVFSCLN